MTLVTSDVESPINGKEAKMTREKLQPFEKAKVRPEIVIAKARMMVPIFSPRAFCTAKTSLPNLEESSEGLIVSYQALSYLSSAYKYATLNFLAILSLNISKKE